MSSRMGRIVLHLPRADGTASENAALPGALQTPSGLAILEIQGTLNTTPGDEGETVEQSALQIGRLSFPLYDPQGDPGNTTWHKQVYLFIGENQRLTGELKKLTNPLALIQRRAQTSDETQGDDELEIAEIVYYKLAFNSRPEPFGVLQADT